MLTIAEVSNLVEDTLSIFETNEKWHHNIPCVALHVSRSRYTASWTMSTWPADDQERWHCVYVYQPAPPVSRRRLPSQTIRACEAKTSLQTHHSDKLHQ